jgi:hypothetical protein
LSRLLRKQKWHETERKKYDHRQTRFHNYLPYRIWFLVFFPNA